MADSLFSITDCNGSRLTVDNRPDGFRFRLETTTGREVFFYASYKQIQAFAEIFNEVNDVTATGQQVTHNDGRAESW